MLALAQALSLAMHAILAAVVARPAPAYEELVAAGLDLVQQQDHSMKSGNRRGGHLRGGAQEHEVISLLLLCLAAILIAAFLVLLSGAASAGKVGR